MGTLRIFSLAGIPVGVAPGFLFLVALFGYQVSSAGIGAILGVVLALTLSLLVHEFGHALVARRYKLGPEVELHMWGGLCRHQFARKNSHDVFIVVGGPLLQIIVGALAWLGLRELRPAIGYPESTGEIFALMFGENFVLFSVFWGAANLLAPIFPLDGGQLFRMLLLRFVKPAARAERIVHIVGIVLSALIAILSLAVWNETFLAIMATTWAIENGRWFASGGTPVPIRLRSELADKLLAEAAELAKAGEWHEVRRLAFQARDEKTVTDDQLARIFELVTVASAELRDWSEALAWSPRAPRTAPAFVARLRALCGLGKRDQARAELAAPDAVSLAAPVRAKVEAWIAGSAAP